MGYKRILIVEDDMPRQLTLKSAAEKLDVLADIYVTDNLDEAKSYISGHSDTELVIMGWDFPASISSMIVEENGEELLRFVKNCGIKAVVCSNRAEQLRDDPELSGTPLILPIPLGTVEERLLACL
ncbi:response regulator [Candidatus Saccharibacteria bacterium]|nr:response regulator [Candidatus Saccharibacteria bacterium]